MDRAVMLIVLIPRGGPHFTSRLKGTLLVLNCPTEGCMSPSMTPEPAFEACIAFVGRRQKSVEKVLECRVAWIISANEVRFSVLFPELLIARYGGKWVLHAWNISHADLGATTCLIHHSFPHELGVN
ncbi:hypothetical protein KC19_9G086400 [Ceratodon purpureus]|uniref:Uncharacterized protein n=1 Tax=Ceratodon purpureus TaxID=3225 RepID=A0A8T0GQ40_CERPU|nr:hypothetical protein KC19_9G086400 [Ceratodon purpureus]